MFSQIVGMSVGFVSSFAVGRVLKLVFEKLIAEEEGRKLIVRVGMAAIAGVVSSAIGMAIQKEITNIIDIVDDAVKTVKIKFHVQKESK